MPKHYLLLQIPIVLLVKHHRTLKTPPVVVKPKQVLFEFPAGLALEGFAGCLNQKKYLFFFRKALKVWVGDNGEHSKRPRTIRQCTFFLVLVSFRKNI
jgi:hypothetical protein